MSTLLPPPPPSFNSQGASVGQDEEDQKPLSDEGEPGGVVTENDSEEPDNQEEEEGEEKKKKPDTDDDEPPPPYSKDDPQEEKPEDADPQGDERASEATNCQQPKLDSGQTGTSIPVTQDEQLAPEPPQIEVDTTKLETRSTDDIDSPDNTTPSPLSPASPISPAMLSRISSPDRGRSLSDLTRITPEESALLSQAYIPPQSSTDQETANEPGQEDLSSSDNTVVNSQSQPSQSELGQESTSSTLTSGSLTRDYNSTPVYVSSPTSDRDQRSTPRVAKSNDGKKVKSKEKISKRVKKRFPPKSIPRSYKSAQQSKDSCPSTPTQENLSVKYPLSTQMALGSSQESSCFEGLSPELSDFGEHSNEVETEPREVRIRKSGSGYGFNLGYDDKNSCIVVKSVSSSGAVGRDGRIRAGDRVTSINGKSLAGLNLSKAKQILKRASNRSEELVIVYTPAPQVQGYSLPSSSAQFINSPGARSSITDAVIGGQSAQQSGYYPQGNMQVSSGSVVVE